ncbi:MAG: ATP-binding protein [Polyangiaceae bacterium]
MPEDAHPNHPSDRDLAGALHEVSNDLTVVLGWLEQARAAFGQTDDSDTRRAVLDALEVATSRARRAHRLARRAIGAEFGRSSTEPLGGLLETALRGVEPIARARGVSLTHLSAPALGAIPIDAGDKLVQVLTNLLLNAIDATAPSSTVELLATLADAGVVRIAVADAGPGIPDDRRENLFARGASGRTGGAGIGLSHASAITREEGGHLELEPFSAGRGATFVVSWPVGQALSQPSPHTQRAAMLDGVRVAVVDDDRAVVDLLEMVLTARGARCSSYATPELLDAAFASGASFDVALLDASPFGEEFAARLETLRRTYPKLDIVLISGAADPPVALERHGVTWIRKPFEVAEVIGVLALLRTHREGVPDTTPSPR